MAPTVRIFLRPKAPTRLALEVAGPDRLTFEEIVRKSSAWLGWRQDAVLGIFWLMIAKPAIAIL